MTRRVTFRVEASKVFGRKGAQAESNHRLVGSKGFALGGSRAEPWPCFLPSFPRAGNGHEVPPPPPRLWVLNAAASFADAASGQVGGRRPGIGGSKRAFQRSTRPEFGCLASVQRRPRPSLRKRRHPDLAVIRLYAVGAVIPGHDVSGTGWQILGRATQSITTMMPEWQCGHSRNDCPVSASERSR
jgi:hypothetical protein